MLCGIHYHSPHSQQQSRFLRSFRSHRSLKDCTQEEEEMYCRPRKPSDASSLASSASETSSRPSTSSRRTDMSVDWDPLRLHPPLAAGPAPPLRDAGDAHTSRRYEPHELRQARSSHNLGRSPPQHHTQPSPSQTVIYDGFDFGFPSAGSSSSSSKPTPTTATTTSSRRRRRDPSPTPSDASSILSSISSDSTLSGSDGDLPLGFGLAPAPAARSRPRPRPPLHYEAQSGTSGLDDDTEFFIRRGGWKRRGIVFANTGFELAGEEESFEF